MVKTQYCLHCLDSGESIELSSPICLHCGRFNEEYIEVVKIPVSIVPNKKEGVEFTLQEKIEQVVNDESKIKNKIKRTKTK